MRKVTAIRVFLAHIAQVTHLADLITFSKGARKALYNRNWDDAIANIAILYSMLTINEMLNLIINCLSARTQHTDANTYSYIFLFPFFFTTLVTTSSKWGKHTKFTNRAGLVVQMLRDDIAPEMCTVAWAKMYEMLVTQDLLPEDNPAAAQSSPGMKQIRELLLWKVSCNAAVCHAIWYLYVRLFNLTVTVLQYDRAVRTDCDCHMCIHVKRGTKETSRILPHVMLFITCH